MLQKQHVIRSSYDCYDDDIICCTSCVMHLDGDCGGFMRRGMWHPRYENNDYDNDELSSAQHCYFSIVQKKCSTFLHRNLA